MNTTQYDYIVIGAGSSGCIVAAQLSANPSLRVLLLEAGDRAENNPETLRSDGYKYAFANNNVIWERFSVPQPESAKQRLFMGSGTGMGGSGSVNAMVYTRGSREDYLSWPKGWQWDDIVPDFEAIERVLRPNRRTPTRWTEACIGAARETGMRVKEDLNDGDLASVLGYEWMNFENAERRSSYVAYLKPELFRPNLTLHTRARVQRIGFDEERVARTVEYEVDGTLHSATVQREVILCAGALETPKLLMLSGVGPRSELEPHGIPVVLDAPEIGANFHDHPNIALFFRGKQPVDCDFPQLYGFDRVNPATELPAGQADTCFVFYPAGSSLRQLAKRMSAMRLPAWLFQFKLVRRLVGALAYWFLGLPPVARFIQTLWGIVVILGKPLSRGRVRLASRNPNAQAQLDPAYFRDPRDLETIILGVEKALALCHSQSMSAWGNQPLQPPAALSASRARLSTFIQQNAMTTFHFAGTCRMGDDASAPVGSDLRLRGVRGVRVADASVMPFTPVSALNAPSMLIGYRAARAVLASLREPERAVVRQDAAAATTAAAQR